MAKTLTLREEREVLLDQIEGMKNEIARVSARRNGRVNPSLTPVLSDLFETKRALRSKLESLEERHAIRSRPRHMNPHIAQLSAREYPIFDTRR